MAGSSIDIQTWFPYISFPRRQFCCNKPRNLTVSQVATDLLFLLLTSDKSLLEIIILPLEEKL